MTEPFCRHHASSCANRTKVRRIPLLHSRATSKASTPPLRMRGNNCTIRGCGSPSGSVTSPESSNWYPMLASSRMAILPPRRRTAGTRRSQAAAWRFRCPTDGQQLRSQAAAQRYCHPARGQQAYAFRAAIRSALYPADSSSPNICAWISRSKVSDSTSKSCFTAAFAMERKSCCFMPSMMATRSSAGTFSTERLICR